MALFLNYVWHWSKQNKVAIAAVYLIFLVPIVTLNIWKNAYLFAEMKKSGGYARWSTAIYELSDYLKDNKINNPVTFGFGLKHNLIFLSDFEVMPIQLDERCDFETVEKEYRLLSMKQEPIYYLKRDSEDYWRNYNFFMTLAKKEGKSESLEKVFLNNTDRGVYWLYKIVN